MENSFAQWKATIKANLADVRDVIPTAPHDQRMALTSQIAELAAVIRPQDTAAYFRHLQTYLPGHDA